MADVSLDADADVALRVSQACADVGRLAAVLDGAAPPEREAHASFAAASLAALCERAGWRTRALNGSPLEVELDVRHGPLHAPIEPRGDAVVVAAPLVDDGVVPV